MALETPLSNVISPIPSIVIEYWDIISGVKFYYDPVFNISFGTEALNLGCSVYERIYETYDSCLNTIGRSCVKLKTDDFSSMVHRFFPFFVSSSSAPSAFFVGFKPYYCEGPPYIYPSPLLPLSTVTPYNFDAFPYTCPKIHNITVLLSHLRYIYLNNFFEVDGGQIVNVTEESWYTTAIWDPIISTTNRGFTVTYTVSLQNFPYLNYTINMQTEAFAEATTSVRPPYCRPYPYDLIEYSDSTYMIVNYNIRFPLSPIPTRIYLVYYYGNTVEIVNGYNFKVFSNIILDEYGGTEFDYYRYKIWEYYKSCDGSGGLYDCNERTMYSNQTGTTYWHKKHIPAYDFLSNGDIKLTISEDVTKLVDSHISLLVVSDEYGTLKNDDYDFGYENRYTYIIYECSKFAFDKNYYLYD